MKPTVYRFRHSERTREVGDRPFGEAGHRAQRLRADREEDSSGRVGGDEIFTRRADPIGGSR